ncbi:uncharacterized protein SCHCODRAFT_02522377 [Schizophyllum commune H4-8]|nr:uncharacterized protein SCHCODRAFT_02522377 [Schizophyllum commune H4-8]KAI5899012.1 hypothetical protein SCHCODRAFT_02522377 [Schizophyllum commune H4-8]
MDLFRATRAKDRRTMPNGRHTTPRERRTMPSEHRTTPSEHCIKYNLKRGIQPDDTLRIPSWHASDHPSLSVMSSDHPSLSVTSSDCSWHASDRSSTCPVIYHNCRCSYTCPVRGSSASRGGSHSTCREGDHTSCPPRGRPLSQTYGTPSDQLRRAEHHHRGSTFSFHDGRLSSHNAYGLPPADDYHLSTCSGSCLSSSTTYSPPPYRASRPEFTYHISSKDRRWKVLLQDTIRRPVRSLVPGRPHPPNIRQIHTLSKRALGDIVRQALKLSKLDLVRKRSGLSISGASSAEGDSSATLFEGPTATGNAIERPVPSFLPSSPCHNTYAAPHDWPGDRIGNAGSLREDAGSLREDAGSLREDAGGLREDAGGLREDAGSLREDAGSLREDAGSLREDAGSLREDAGSLREDAGGLVDSDHAGGIGEDAGALYYVAGEAFNFDDPSGFEDYAGGSVNDDPSSLNDYSSSLDDDDNTSTISLLNGEPLADADLCVSLHLSSSSTPYSHSSRWIKSWIAQVTVSRREAREDSCELH